MPVVLTPPVAIHRPASTVPTEHHYGRLVRRVQSEYLEMPGLRLTFDQACRLWAIDRRTCARILEDLVADGFLTVSEAGTYVRRTNA